MPYHFDDEEFEALRTDPLTAQALIRFVYRLDAYLNQVGPLPDWYRMLPEARVEELTKEKSELQAEETRLKAEARKRLWMSFPEAKAFLEERDWYVRDTGFCRSPEGLAMELCIEEPERTDPLYRQMNYRLRNADATNYKLVQWALRRTIKDGEVVLREGLE